MTLRGRITLWHAVILLVSLLIMGGVFHYELNEDRLAMRSGQLLDPSWEETGEFLLFFGLPTALLLLCGGTWFIHRALTPVARLTEAVERIQLHHLHEKIPPTGTGDELDRLTQVFNAMIDRLRDSFERVREFTLHASHEIKTPLTILRGELETALREDAGQAPPQELLGSLLDEINRLAQIVDGLTLLAKADAGQLTMKMEPVQLDELVQDSFADAQVLVQSRHIAVTLNACDPVVVQADRYRLRQLLLNLTDNAIKHNHPQGRVEIALEHHHDSVELRISNTGPGIPPEILPRVFDRFFRGDPAHGTEMEGCGLGLTIAQWIVRAHGGTLTLASEPNKLTTVTIRLPLPPGGTQINLPANKMAERPGTAGSRSA